MCQLEFHRGTLTDTVDSALALLADVGRPELTSYWQPHRGDADDEALRTLFLLGDRVRTIHVFSWWPDHEALPLVAREALWRRVFGHLADKGEPDALLEFVPDADPAVLTREAATLRRWVDRPAQ